MPKKSTVDKPNESNTDFAAAFPAFDRAMRGLMNVPKAELDAALAKSKSAEAKPKAKRSK